MKLCIAEKPSVAKEIATILGAKSRKDGYYEGNGYAVSWTFGHFCELNNPDDYKESWKKWSLDSLPMLPEKFETKLKNDKGVKKQFKILKSLFAKAELVINCGDAGQEGELIQRWVIQKANYKGPVERLWISSLTKEAIEDGFRHLKPASDFDRLYYAGSARAIGDWLLGMNATRLYTLKYGGYKQVLSIGRVQTPTLAMVVNRQLEIDNFVSEPFWELQTVYRDTTFSYEDGRFQNEREGTDLLEKVSDEIFTIISFEKKKGKEFAPKLFDLTSLQVHCNRRFSYTAEQTLKIVQKLYEMKLVTYPRVDTNYLPDDMYPKIAGILKQLTNYDQFTKSILSKKISKTKRVFDNKKVTDHHAIIPTGSQANLDQLNQNVYDAIVRQFLAAFYPECIVSNTTVKGEAAEIIFKTKGKEILDPGWKVVFPKKPKKDEDGEEKIMPSFEKGETGPHEPTLAQKHTQPPKFFTEATLLRAMESAGKQIDDESLRDIMKANGIGRPSTRANIIETLFRRKYIQRQRKNIIATDTGIQLIQTLQNDLIKSPELTGIWEKQLREIENGNYSPVKFINDMKTMIDKLVTEVRMEKATFKIAPKVSQKRTPPRTHKSSKAKGSAVELKCPKCGEGNLILGKSAYGCSTWKSGCDFRLPFVYKSKKISQIQIKRLVQKGSTVSLKGFVSDGTKVEGIVKLDDNFNLQFQPKNQTEQRVKQGAGASVRCPKCSKGQLIRGKTAYGCSDWKSGCDFTFSFEKLRAAANGRILTKELALEILSKAHL